MSSHEPSQQEWRDIAGQVAGEKDPGKLIDLARRLVEKYDEEQHKKSSSSVTSDAK